jgi:MFS family permease
MNNVVLIGLVSFFADLSTEMVYPLIPLYLTSVFGATPALVGLIEGIAESVASLLKVFGGYATDKYQKKKSIAFLGYAAGLVYKVALLFAGSWVSILFARVFDRFGKGIRTAPRDVLVSESSDASKLGHSFGLHKSLDMAGSAAGILVAFFIMKTWHEPFAYKKLFLLSCIPAIASLFMFVFIKETKRQREAKPKHHIFRGLKELDSRLKLYLFVVFVFTLGNSSNTFLLLRAQKVGFDSATIVLLYFLYNIVSSLLSVPFGKGSDRIGRKWVLVAGYTTFALVYAGFAWAGSPFVIVAAFALYGVFTAMTAGVERAFIAEIAPKEIKGTLLGLHSTIVGIALFPASLVAGLLWNSLGPEVPFALGASLSLFAAVMLAFGLPSNAKTVTAPC